MSRGYPFPHVKPQSGMASACRRHVNEDGSVIYDDDCPRCVEEKVQRVISTWLNSPSPELTNPIAAAMDRFCLALRHVACAQAQASDTFHRAYYGFVGYRDLGWSHCAPTKHHVLCCDPDTHEPKRNPT